MNELIEQVEYTAKDGTKIYLTIDDVKKYLVQGKSDACTLQEMVFFIHICKARGMNPFKRDCYLIKYTDNDPAQIVTSIDFIRARALSHRDCEGWEIFLIVQNEKREIKLSKGLVQPDEIILGAQFKGHRRGWTIPLQHEVNLASYIKYRKDIKDNFGKQVPTAFWQPINQPSQIMKVAESQGLRRLFADELQGLSCDVEISDDKEEHLTREIEKEPEKKGKSKFEQLVEILKEGDAQIIEVQVEQYINSLANHYRVEIDDITKQAIERPNDFLGAFNKWKEKLQDEEKRDGMENQEVKNRDIPEEGKGKQLNF